MFHTPPSGGAKQSKKQKNTSSKFQKAKKSGRKIYNKISFQNEILLYIHCQKNAGTNFVSVRLGDRKL
jgi:hypothetical protein